MNELDTLVDTARADFALANAPADLENAKARFLGKAGRITELMKGKDIHFPSNKWETHIK